MPPHQPPRRKILIVDDESDLRDIVSDVVRDAGYTPFLAEDGASALEILSRESIQAIICDINMPQMDGVQLLRIIRSKGFNVPFVFLTGFASDVNMLEAVRLGALQFLTKPFERVELETCIHRALEVGSKEETISESLASIKNRYPELSKEIEQLERDRSQVERLKVSRSHSN